MAHTKNRIVELELNPNLCRLLRRTAKSEKKEDMIKALWGIITIGSFIQEEFLHRLKR